LWQVGDVPDRQRANCVPAEVIVRLQTQHIVAALLEREDPVGVVGRLASEGARTRGFGGATTTSSTTSAPRCTSSREALAAGLPPDHVLG